MIRAAFFQTHRYERDIFTLEAAKHGVELSFLEPRLTSQTAMLAAGFDVAVSFVNDKVDELTLKTLKEIGVRILALRCAGFNHVDLEAASKIGIPVVRVPAYSPHAVAEHTICLLLALSRKIHKAYMRVQSHNFSLEGLVGFELYRKTVGVVGTGKIGAQVVRILNGFGCKVLAFDETPCDSLASICQYTDFDTLLAKSDVLSLHVPLTPSTHHMLNGESISKTKRGVIILNTSRGALIDSKALIDGLKSGHISAAGLDVYDEEESIFFQDLSDEILHDDILARLLTFQNTIITSHQAFLTREALSQIAQTTIKNLTQYFNHGVLENAVLSKQGE